MSGPTMVRVSSGRGASDRTRGLSLEALAVADQMWCICLERGEPVKQGKRWTDVLCPARWLAPEAVCEQLPKHPRTTPGRVQAAMKELASVGLFAREGETVRAVGLAKWNIQSFRRKGSDAPKRPDWTPIAKGIQARLEAAIERCTDHPSLRARPMTPAQGSAWMRCVEIAGGAEDLGKRIDYIFDVYRPDGEFDWRPNMYSGIQWEKHYARIDALYRTAGCGGGVAGAARAWEGLLAWSRQPRRAASELPEATRAACEMFGKNGAFDLTATSNSVEQLARNKAEFIRAYRSTT